MSKTMYERGKTLTYPSIYPVLTFTPIFGHRGDFVWIEKVMAAWPEHDSEFAFVNSTMHDERVDSLKAENAKLRKENDDLTRLANIDAMMMFLSSNCLFKDCSECEVKPLCDEEVYLQGLYGIDKDLVSEVGMKFEVDDGD